MYILHVFEPSLTACLPFFIKTYNIMELCHDNNKSFYHNKIFPYDSNLVKKLSEFREGKFLPGKVLLGHIHHSILWSRRHLTSG